MWHNGNKYFNMGGFLWQLKIVKRNHFGTTNTCFKTPITIQASKKLEWEFVKFWDK